MRTLPDILNVPLHQLSWVKFLLALVFVGMSQFSRGQPPVPPEISAPWCPLLGSSFTISATVANGDSVTWQWLRDGIPIPDATNSSLVLPEFTIAAFGSYSVNANDGFGISRSRAIMLVDCEYFQRDVQKPGLFYPAVAPGFNSVKYLNGGFMAVGTGIHGFSAVYHSWDGDNWNPLWQLADWPGGTFRDLEYGNNRFVFVTTDSLALLEGNIWGVRDVDYTFVQAAPPFLVSSLAFGNGVFVASGVSNNVDGYVAVSADAINWERQLVGVGVAMNNIVFANGRFVGTGQTAFGDAYIVISTNGTEWKTMIRTNSSVAAVSFADGRFRAAAFDRSSGQRSIQSSIDGVDWRSDWPFAANACNGPVFVSGNSQLIGIHTLSEYWNGCPGTYPSDTRFLFSPDGVSLTSSGRTRALKLNSICYGNRKFIAAGDGGLLAQSINGTNWSLVADERSLKLNGIQFDQNVFIVLGDGFFGVSSNGAHWSFRHVTNEFDVFAGLPGSNSLETVVYGQGRWIASGPRLTVISTNLQQWSGPITQAPGMRSLAFGNGVFVGISSSFGRAYASATGTNWLNLFPVSGLRSVVFAKDIFVAVGTNGAVYTSADGWGWLERASGTTQTFISIAYGSDGFIGSNSFVAITGNGACHGSGDGITWYPIADVSWGEVTCVANAFDTFLVANSSGGIRTIPTSYFVQGSAPIRAMASGNGVFATIGDNGLRVHQRAFPPANVVITGQPQGRVAHPGVTFQLSVCAYGKKLSQRNPASGRFEPALLYQWRRDGEVIVDATNAFLLFTDVVETDSGDYSVVVSDGDYTVTSDSATVSITRPQLVVAREAAMLRLSFSGIPDQNYLIQQRAAFDLIDPWNTLTNVFGGAAPTAWYAPLSIDTPAAFYRAILPP